MLGLEAVLPTGEIIRTGGKTVKNVVGYDLTQLLVGSEGTLAIITEIIAAARCRSRRRRRRCARRSRASTAAVDAVDAAHRARGVVPADARADRRRVASRRWRAYLGGARWRRPARRALLLIEVDGLAERSRPRRARVEAACRAAGATEVLARDDRGRAARSSGASAASCRPSLQTIAPLKFNHDVVVPHGRVPAAVRAGRASCGARYGLRIPCFGHAGDGNIHVNIMVTPDDAATRSRARTRPKRALFDGVVALEGSISGEHGIGFAKAPYLGLELSPETIALMKRVKQAFDPHGILNPGKIFAG